MNQIKQLMHSQIMKKALFFVICTLYLSPAVAQQTLRGRVIDASTGHALEGAIVSSNQIKGYSSLTDEEGRYEIIVPDYCSALSFSAPDFETAILGIGGQTTMPDVSLYPTIPTAYSPSSLTIEEDIQRQLSSQVYTISRIRYGFRFTFDFNKVFILQLILLAICVALTVLSTTVWMKYVFGSILIAISAWISLSGLEKRMGLLSSVKMRIKK